MNAIRNRKGFTVLELLIVVVIFTVIAISTIWLVVVPFIAKGNCWFTQEGLIREIRFNHPEAEIIVKTETHFTDLSTITVQNNDGSRDKYTLDSDILFNYDLKKVERSDSLDKATLKNK
ncbi:MAG: prepilin-type N-terminal cleavage/methylation domain-containing protein [Candidatus Vogelbacteria bacterium]|nr:prepilin-type N-terminal cleavage/methylation domain-containing protein [Candidatus Vogelbacteria bacterium]